MISVLLADDQDLVRGGFRLILEAEDDLEVVGDAGDGRAAVEQARRLRPDVVLMDVRMPELDGIAATRTVVTDALARKVLVLTTLDEDRVVYDALRAGGSGFLLKTPPPAQLAEAVRTVAGGEAPLAREVVRRLVEGFVTGPPPEDAELPAPAELTQREREVLTLIARELFLSAATVKTHVNRLFWKLGLRDRVQAVVLAYEAGPVRPGAAGAAVS
jgi:DNA-binding NarL/FixJ family response regulator